MKGVADEIEGFHRINLDTDISLVSLGEAKRWKDGSWWWSSGEFFLDLEQMTCGKN